MALDPAEHERLFAAALPRHTPPQAAAALAAAFQPSLVAYGQAPGLAAAVLEPPALSDELAAVAVAGAPQLAEARRLRAASPAWLPAAEAKDLLAAYRAWAKEHGLSARDVLRPLRVALTASEHGPELPFVLAAIDRDETLRRIDSATGDAREPTTKGDTT